MEELFSKIVSLSKRRGFIFQSSEIYGGFGGAYDFGPLGTELKNNIKKAWWDEMTRFQADVVGLDAAILMSPQVWQASGHLTAGFADELVECKGCHKRFRVDEAKTEKCPECDGLLTPPRKFNLMMKTFVGPLEEEAAVSYLRAETCQGIYVNFENILDSMRLKLPFGVAQIGKSFRNEITPKDFIYRTREFEQMEMQWFCRPPQPGKENSAVAEKTLRSPDQWFDFWLDQRLKWYSQFGIKKENLKSKEVPESERAHYARRQMDIEYHFPFGWREIEGIHNRGDWDLSNHAKHSGRDLTYRDAETGERYIPHIIETSVGVDRSLLAFLCDAYEEVKGGRTSTTKAAKEIETVLRLHKNLAPVKVAILPLVKNKPELVKKAKDVYAMLKTQFLCQYDEVGSIGRRYRRQDEVGTPLAITVDFESLEREDATVRDRDTMKQERVKIKDLPDYIAKYLRD